MIVTGFVAVYTREEGERKGACWGWRRLNQALRLHLLWFIPISLSPAVALGGSEFAVQCCATFPSWLLRLKYQLQPIGTPANEGKAFNVPIMWKLGHNTEQCMTAELFLALQPVIKRIQSSKQSFHGYLATKQVSHYYLKSGAKSRHVLMESPSTPSCVHSHSILSASSPLTWFLSQTLMLAVFLLTCLLWLFIQTCKWTCLKKMHLHEEVIPVQPSVTWVWQTCPIARVSPGICSTFCSSASPTFLFRGRQKQTGPTIPRHWEKELEQNPSLGNPWTRVFLSAFLPKTKQLRKD